MEICNQYFSPEIIKRIQQVIEDEPDISRRKLSLQLCTWLDWRAINGNWQEMSCRKALNQLDAKGYITLPEATHDYAFNHVKNDVKEVLPDLQEISGAINQLGQIEIIPIKNRQHINSSIWHALIKEYHPNSAPFPLGRCRIWVGVVKMRLRRICGVIYNYPNLNKKSNFAG